MLPSHLQLLTVPKLLSTGNANVLKGMRNGNLRLHTNSWLNPDGNYNSKNEDISSYVQPCTPLFSCFVYKQNRNLSSTIFHASTVQFVTKKIIHLRNNYFVNTQKLHCAKVFLKNRVSTLTIRNLFWFWCTHRTWVADGTYQTSTMAPRIAFLHRRNWCQVCEAKRRQLELRWRLLQISCQSGVSKGIQKDWNSWAKDQEGSQWLVSHSSLISRKSGGSSLISISWNPVSSTQPASDLQQMGTWRKLTPCGYRHFTLVLLL
jgi:hypothetical protein